MRGTAWQFQRTCPGFGHGAPQVGEALQLRGGNPRGSKTRKCHNMKTLKISRPYYCNRILALDTRADKRGGALTGMEHILRLGLRASGAETLYFRLNVTKQASEPTMFSDTELEHGMIRHINFGAQWSGL